MAEYIEREATCCDCIHSEICENMPTLTGWDALNPVYCKLFKNAADVAPVVHGRWIDNTFCSNCNGFSEDDEGHIILSYSEYCPKCGARMDGE